MGKIATATGTATTAVAASTLASTFPSTTSSMKYGNTVKRPITTKTIVKNNSLKSKSKTKNVGRNSTTIRPKTISVGNMTAQSMSLTMNSLADLDHPEKLNLELQSGMISFLHFSLIPLVTFHYVIIFLQLNRTDLSLSSI